MDAMAPEDFKHTTLKRYPDRIVGVSFLQESPGFTGIYLRDPEGGLWPARTVNQSMKDHHAAVLAAWKDKYQE